MPESQWTHPLRQDDMVNERATRRSRDSGAAAVEFALVVPILLVLVFGIIDYGLYFSDSLATRSGVREGARQGVVGTCADMPCLAQLVKDRIDPIAGGEEFVKIQVVDPVTRASAAWGRGKDLVVCAVVRVNGVTGYVPLPGASTTRSRVSMRIEQASQTSIANNYEDAAAPPGGWDFCT
ncbi:MAG: TadE family protein [Actinomycetes bacterium]